MSIPSLQQYQLAFTQHLRDPKQHKRPKGVASDGIAVYEEIVFNNIFASVSACFPVAQKVSGKRRWLHLVRSFFRDHAADSPLFRHIPAAFVDYLKQHEASLDIPAYLSSLCHYEWIELAVATNNQQSDWLAIDIDGDLLDSRPVFNPALELLDYASDVHKISARYKPTEPVSTQLLVYRDAEDRVNFVELNVVTFSLIALLLDQKLTGRQALQQISQQLDHAEPENVVQFGLQILEDFKRQGIILGVLK